MKYPLFFNNTAKSARANKFRSWFAKNTDHFDLIEPSSADDMKTRLQAQAAQNTPIVAVAGGDGTLGIAAQALANTNTALAVFPAGTANVFSLEMGFKSGFDFAWQVLKQGKTQNIDLFAINGKPFLQMAGIGLDARAVELTTWELKKKWGPLSYVFSAVKAMKEPLPHLTLTTDSGETISARSILLGNGAKYGGNFPLFGDACNTDGQLDIVAFTNPLSSILLECSKALVSRGFHINANNANFRYLRCSAATISCDSPIPCEMDGDHATYTPITITKFGHLKVLVP